MSNLQSNKNNLQRNLPQHTKSHKKNLPPNSVWLKNHHWMSTMPWASWTSHLRMHLVRSLTWRYPPRRINISSSRSYQRGGEAVTGRSHICHLEQVRSASSRSRRQILTRTRSMHKENQSSHMSRAEALRTRRVSKPSLYQGLNQRWSRANTSTLNLAEPPTLLRVKARSKRPVTTHQSILPRS